MTSNADGPVKTTSQGPSLPEERAGALIFGALACNTIYYIVAGRFSEALESVAWYTLLILFHLEITRLQVAALPWARTAIRAGRVAATVAIAITAVLYVREQEWLDATNLFLWIAVVTLLEIEVRRPASVTMHRKAFTTVAVTLYLGLGALVLTWLVIGKWMNAWDATLWLAAFGLLELNVLRESIKIL